MTLGELRQYINIALTGYFEKKETEALTLELTKFFSSASKTDIIVHTDRECDIKIYDVDNAIKRLLDNEPIDYIIGEREFFSYYFEVTPAVLIPRPETEELVRLIIDSTHNFLHGNLLDIGTGSGAIAITVSLKAPNFDVEALDISRNALTVAVRNAQRLKADRVTFKQCDILKTESLGTSKYDIIVSNPPYIRNSEQILMKSNVLNYEPHEALFVSDSDPLIFYRKIATLGLDALKLNGELFFEINEAFGSETLEMLTLLGYQDIAIHRDLFGKERMVSAKKI